MAFTIHDDEVCWHHAFFVKCLLKNEGIFVRVQHVFKRKFILKQRDSVPNCLTMSRWLINFNKTGATTNICYRTNERIVRMPENFKYVRITMEHNSQGTQTSLQQATAFLCLPYTTVHQILWRDFSYYSYKLHVTQKLKPTDFTKKRDFCEQLLRLGKPDKDGVFFPNKAHFKLNSLVNKQNMCC